MANSEEEEEIAGFDNDDDDGDIRKYKLSGRCNGSSGNMRRHLEKKHPFQFSAIENSERDEFIFCQETFRAAICKWIVATDQPFTAAQEKVFVELLDTLNPDAKSVSDKTVRADIMADYEVKLEQLKTIISSVPGKISVTLDAWTSKNCLAFLAIRGHWIDSEWKYESKLLDFAFIDGKHDGFNHSQILLKCLERLDIPILKILAITLDNATNNNTLFDFLEGISIDSSRVRCLAHIINLAAQDLLGALKTAAPEIDDTKDDDYDIEVLDDIDMNQEIDDDDDEVVEFDASVM